MQLNEAIALLQHKSFHPAGIQSWADLGCGSGLFTAALASLLHPGSNIYAVDSNFSALNKINFSGNVAIKPIQSDFIKDTFEFMDLDGILMANSLHYVKDKPAFIHKIMKYLKPDGFFLIVEYDTDSPVYNWVPYPLSFLSLKRLFAEAGYKSAIKMQERPSLYNSGNMYSALLRSSR